MARCAAIIYLVLHDIRGNVPTANCYDLGKSLWWGPSIVKIAQCICLVDGEQEGIVNVILIG